MEFKKKEGNKVAINLRLTEKNHQRLKEIAKKHGVTKTSVATTIVNNYLEQ